MFQKRFKKERSVFSQKVRYFPHPENGPRSGPGPQKKDLGPDLDHKLAVL